MRGVLLWAEPWGRLAASVGCMETNLPGRDVRTTHLHAYGVWFPSQRLTLAAKAGGFAGVNDGEYLAGATNIYLTPDLALFTAVERTWYDAGFRDKGLTGSVGWPPVRKAPFALNMGVTRTEVSGPFNFGATTAFVGVRTFYNRSGETTLRGREPTGPTGWPLTFGPQGLGLRAPRPAGGV